MCLSLIMILNKLLKFSPRIHLKWNLKIRPSSQGCMIVTINCLVKKTSFRFYTDSTHKDPSKAKEEKIASVKMPGFVHPDSMNEEGYFTQRAKQQLEELKKRLDKPTAENTERKD